MNRTVVRCSPTVTKTALGYGVCLTDYYLSESLRILNALPTAGMGAHQGFEKTEELGTNETLFRRL